MSVRLLNLYHMVGLVRTFVLLYKIHQQWLRYMVGSENPFCRMDAL